MTRPGWRVRLSDRAATDFAEIIDWTIDEFGTHRANTYIALLMRCLRTLEGGPYVTGTQDRAALQPGLRSIRALRTRHVVLFRAPPDTAGGTITVLRILHDAMDPARHLPQAEDPA
ncbi:MAG: type II toxin-antitoxin system RelE/ParE family toxin [Acetobacteraceae bacterium]|nr:type II toxin-antitoxin system RelE/ParE family toxin [Acetobacteraceae bacterium]